MSTEHIVIFLAIGALAGFIAGHIWKGRGFGLLGDLIVGVIGSFIGVWLFGQFRISSAGFFGLLVAAVIGALVLLYLIRLVKHH